MCRFLFDRDAETNFILAVVSRLENEPLAVIDQEKYGLRGSKAAVESFCACFHVRGIETHVLTFVQYNTVSAYQPLNADTRF